MAETTSSSTVSEKSWHLLALLLKIGHPLSPQHLASQCQLFTASPSFIAYVISLPGSPLSVTDNGLVTPSPAALFALGSFFSATTAAVANSRKRKGIFVDLINFSSPIRSLFFNAEEDAFADGRDKKRLAISNEVHDISLESYADIARAMVRRNLPTIKFESLTMHSANAMVPAMIPLHIDDSNGECSAWNFEHREADNDAIASTSMFPGEISRTVIKASDSLFMTGSVLNCQHLVGNCALPTTSQDPSLCNEALVGSSAFGKKMDYFETLHEYPEQNVHPVDHGIFKSNTCKDPIRESNEEEGAQVECGLKEELIGTGTEREKGDITQKVNPAICGEELTTGVEPKNLLCSSTLDKDEIVRNIETQSTYKIGHPSSKQFLKSSIVKGGQKNDLHPKSQVLIESVACKKLDNAPNVDECKNDQNTRHKLRQSRKENMAETTSITPKVEKKAHPSFENFTIEEEEGSGGYGTVYRARRKTDGKRVAIKCPHDNAHVNHVNNERNMLERFGGKNFIIKFEGSFKSGSSDCFVLEHVEHDRPEVLKKEINLIQLQWYGYCMFRALACLHKEGVVHRDVKPGNFLFSRKLNKGYLIDFNLAMDIKQKYNIGSKSKPSLGVSNNIPLLSGSAPLVQDKNLVGSKSLTSSKREVADYKKNSQLNRQVKQKAYNDSQKNYAEKAGVSLLRAQGTDGSVITSAKDVTSSKAASAERLRERLPSQGRKELISYALQNSMPCTNNSSVKGPSSQRKRVTAPLSKSDGKILYLTPMPLHSSTVAAGLLRNKGDGKQKREGSCVGTKGFRAPEVLFRSQFQGPKVDIWSAGVTLLYMVIGRTPFTGEPQQNIEDIAKLRGTEELWEVAKLHDRELYFPKELLDDRYLQSWDIESWCKINTKRPEFLQHIPKSLFDLIDKCLTVNPRNRISVEEVLRHEFFASCHEIMRKHRMMRRSLGADAAAASGTI
ncbi:hypothetical protein RIF29_18325 [Crotalaria pallida]|uniref:non-specific serine/threonine protein kinase n=1 Tax=Crotalaria pallida TaxID=3830 RepID=A0AAN9FK88_CROPI